MTDNIRVAAKKVSANSTEIIATNPKNGPESIEGYYDEVFKRKSGIQSAWHHIKFDFVEKKIKDSNKHFDNGCGAGTFLGN